MTRRVTSLEKAPIDVIEAIKRAFIHRGFIPRKYQRNSQLNTESPAKTKPQAPQEDSQEVSQAPDEQEPGEIHEKLIDVTEKAHEVLFKADTVFPFTIFPSTITLDREKLTVANRHFFRTATIVSVPVSSILSAEASVGPIFGTLNMTSKFFAQNVHAVSYLWHGDAIKIQRLLQGFIVAHDKKIDVSEIDKDDLCALLIDLGQGVAD